MSAVKFVLADAASATITVALMVGIGYIGGNSLEILKKDLKRMEHMVIIALVLLIAVGILYAYFKSRRGTIK